MPIYVEGALIGLALGVVLTVFEYSALKRDLKERAARLHKEPEELGPTEKRRISNVLRFSLLLPFGFALAFWIVWG
jgi:hypothetical protein